MANPAENNVKNESPAQENKMGVMPVGKLLFTMSLPIMISMLVQALYNVVDSMFVARVSENALTALSMAFPIQNLMIAVSTGLGVGLNAVLSRALGAKDEKGVNRAATNGIMLLFICGLVFMLGGATIVRPYFEMQTDIAEIVESGVDYTTIVMLGSMGIFMQILFERLLQSTGRTLLTMISQGTGAIINIIFDPIFIFGLFGFPFLIFRLQTAVHFFGGLQALREFGLIAGTFFLPLLKCLDSQKAGFVLPPRLFGFVQQAAAGCRVHEACPPVGDAPIA